MQTPIPISNPVPKASAPAVLAAVLLVFLSSRPANAQPPVLRTLTYAASTEDFPNPERGFYRYRDMTASNDFDIRKDGNTLIFLKLRADAFRSGPLSGDFLDRFQAACDQARKAGVKLMPRVAYNDGPEPGCPAEYGCDAPKAVVMSHIAQLAPLWKKNKDVINLVDPGFIGGWGEWHSSSNGLDNIKDMTDILYAILDSLPSDRMVYVRYPQLKREMFSGSKTSDKVQLTPERAFDLTRNARVGHLNDCLLSSETDVGTYRDFNSGWPRSRETVFIGSESRFTPMGGETCALHEAATCANALKELETLHIDHLNRDYHEQVIQRWKDQGCHDAIARRLGYRFVAESARLPDSVKPGTLLDFSFTLANQGFGELFNPRNLDVTLSGPGTTAGTLTATLTVDPRRMSGGTSLVHESRFTIPAGLAEGVYTVGLRLADRDTALARDPRYSVRFANQDMWNPVSGINELKRNLYVSTQASGPATQAYARFEEVKTGTALRPGAGKSGMKAAQPRRKAAPGPGLLRAGDKDVDFRGRELPGLSSDPR
ncbi:MAG: DUF4832 domain-containing protein [Fibrobacterota bacterium]|nr:DUF4832 domain-containing protein [Fibrobacterota bacterium]